MADSTNHKLLNLDPIYILVAVLVVLITFLIAKKFKRSTNVVLLVGLTDSGKTAIFSKLIFSNPKKSVTSLKENEASLIDLDLKLVDLPGAERLRPRYWDQYREKAHHVVFVIDSTTIDQRLRDLSEYLYALLSDSIIQKNKIVFTVTCHKQDLDEAKGRSDVKSILESELTAIKETRKGQLGRTSEESNEDRLAARFTGDISFDELGVNFIETSINNLDQLVKFMVTL